MSYQEVKVFGERNSSTNALKKLIELNSNSYVVASVAKDRDPWFKYIESKIEKLPRNRQLREWYIDRIFKNVSPKYFWKHAATNFRSINRFHGCLVIFIVRNPASWALSLYKRPYNLIDPIPETFESFLNREFRLRWRDRLGYVKKKPVEIINEKYSSYLGFAERLTGHYSQYIFVYFEEFATDQKSVFLKISNNLIDPVQEPQIVRESTKDQGRYSEYYKKFYGEELWRNQLSSSACKIIRSQADFQTMRRIGYNVL